VYTNPNSKAWCDGGDDLEEQVNFLFLNEISYSNN